MYGYEVDCPSMMIGEIEDQFIDFLFNVKNILSLKDEKKEKELSIGNLLRSKVGIGKDHLENMKFRKSKGMSLNWNQVLRDLKNHTGEGQRIELSEIPAPDESMKEGISLYIDGFSSPIQTQLVSTFKKKLSKFRKITVTPVTSK